VAEAAGLAVGPDRRSGALNAPASHALLELNVGATRSARDCRASCCRSWKNQAGGLPSAAHQLAGVAEKNPPTLALPNTCPSAPALASALNSVSAFCGKFVSKGKWRCVSRA
jgi:hypothetical protein